MSFSQLPNEVLLEIFDATSAADLDNLSSVNRKLYSVSYSSEKMKRRRAAKLNSRVMCERFGKPNASSRALGYHSRCFERGGPIGMCWNQAIPISIPRSRLDFLDFDNDLVWLRDQEILLSLWIECHTILPAKCPFSFASIAAAAASIGVELPSSLHRLNQTSRQRSPTTSIKPKSELVLEGIYKCPKEVDGGAGGFLIPLRWVDGTAQRVCALTSFDFWTLYVDKQGHHCVLRSLRRLEARRVSEGFMHAAALNAVEAVVERVAMSNNELRQPVKIPLADTKTQFMLMTTTSFDAWLALRHYDGQVAYQDHNNLAFDRGTKDFLANVFPGTEPLHPPTLVSPNDRLARG